MFVEKYNEKLRHYSVIVWLNEYYSNYHYKKNKGNVYVLAFRCSKYLSKYFHTVAEQNVHLLCNNNNEPYLVRIAATLSGHVVLDYKSLWQCTAGISLERPANICTKHFRNNMNPFSYNVEAAFFVKIWSIHLFKIRWSHFITKIILFHMRRILWANVLHKSRVAASVLEAFKIYIMSFICNGNFSMIPWLHVLQNKWNFYL